MKKLKVTPISASKQGSSGMGLGRLKIKRVANEATEEDAGVAAGLNM